MFKQKPRLTLESLQDLFDTLESIEDDSSLNCLQQKSSDDLLRNLAVLRNFLHGDSDTDCSIEVSETLLKEFFQEDFIFLLASRVVFLDWESRKNVVQIWYSLVKPSSVYAKKAAGCIQNHPEVFAVLLEGYESKEAAMNSGSMIREALRHASLAWCFLNHEDFPKLFTFIESSNFDVASDAFITLKEAIRKHSDVASEYLAKNFTHFFSMYEKLMVSENYVTKRQSVKLLGEVLLDRGNVNVMLRYINNHKNLRLVMMLLRDPSKNIQFEAFHVFKVFVANPTKAERIAQMLYRNKVQLLDYLKNFHNDREDEEFQEEKDLLIREIAALELEIDD